MGDDRIYDNDFPSAGLGASDGSLHAGAHWSAPSNLRQKDPDFLNKSGTFLCFRFQSLLFPDFLRFPWSQKYHRQGTLPICGKYHEIKAPVQWLDFWSHHIVRNDPHPPFCAGRGRRSSEPVCPRRAEECPSASVYSPLFSIIWRGPDSLLQKHISYSKRYAEKNFLNIA